MLLLYTQTMPSTGRGPPKNRTKDKRKQRLIAWNDDMTMDYDKLQAMSVPPERPTIIRGGPLPRPPRVPRLRMLVRRLPVDIGDKVEGNSPG